MANLSSAGVRRHGFTLLELLVVMAILAIVVGLVVMNGRPIVQGQAQQAAIRTMQQSVWQGATMAASRGVTTNLVLEGNELEVRNSNTNEAIRRFELPDDVTLNIADGTILVFTPPGKVLASSLNDLPDPFQITVNGEARTLEISLIGEVRVEGAN